MILPDSRVLKNLPGQCDKDMVIKGGKTRGELQDYHLETGYHILKD